MIHLAEGVINNLEVIRATNGLFQIEQVERSGLRHTVTWPSSMGTAMVPMHDLICERLAHSPGSSIGQTGAVSWRRKSDAVAAADDAVSLLGRVEKTETPDEDASENGIKVWFTTRQLLKLYELISIGVDHLPALESENPLIVAVVDRVDCAIRAATSRGARAPAGSKTGPQTRGRRER